MFTSSGDRLINLAFQHKNQGCSTYWNMREVTKCISPTADSKLGQMLVKPISVQRDVTTPLKGL